MTAKKIDMSIRKKKKITEDTIDSKYLVIKSVIHIACYRAKNKKIRLNSIDFNKQQLHYYIYFRLSNEKNMREILRLHNLTVKESCQILYRSIENTCL